MTTLTTSRIRPGMAYHDKKLYHFSRTGIVVAAQWPDMRAWRKTPKGSRWMCIRPYLRLTTKASTGWTCELDYREPRTHSFIMELPIRFRMAVRPAVGPMVEGIPGEDAPDVLDRALHGSERQRELGEEYLRTIPETVLDAVSAIPERHWHLLNLLSRCPGSWDLLQSNPALTYCLASLWVFKKPAPLRPLRSARSLITKPQSEIAAWLGFPRSRSTARILRKLAPECCTLPNLLALRKIMKSSVKELQHLPRIDDDVLRMLNWQDQCRFSPRFLAETVSSPTTLPNSDAACVRDVLWMRQHLGDTDLFVVRSRENLAKIHDRCVERMGRADLRLADVPPFPEPPLACPTKFLEVIPLTNQAQLQEEGRVQENCVGAYGPRIRNENLYLYRMLKPERATLAIAKTCSGHWQLSEIKSLRNGPVREETVEAVQWWIEEAMTAGSRALRDPLRIKILLPIVLC